MGRRIEHGHTSLHVVGIATSLANSVDPIALLLLTEKAKTRTLFNGRSQCAIKGTRVSVTNAKKTAVLHSPINTTLQPSVTSNRRKRRGLDRLGRAMKKYYTAITTRNMLRPSPSMDLLGSIHMISLSSIVVSQSST
jgi:hypothetical protein